MRVFAIDLEQILFIDFIAGSSRVWLSSTPDYALDL